MCNRSVWTGSGEFPCFHGNLHSPEVKHRTRKGWLLIGRATGKDAGLEQIERQEHNSRGNHMLNLKLVCAIESRAEIDSGLCNIRYEIDLLTNTTKMAIIVILRLVVIL